MDCPQEKQQDIYSWSHPDAMDISPCPHTPPPTSQFTSSLFEPTPKERSSEASGGSQEWTSLEMPRLVGAGWGLGEGRASG